MNMTIILIVCVLASSAYGIAAKDWRAHPISLAAALAILMFILLHRVPSP